MPPPAAYRLPRHEFPGQPAGRAGDLADADASFSRDFRAHSRASRRYDDGLSF